MIRQAKGGYVLKVRFIMKILIWATSFGADLWGLARYLDGREDVQLKVVMTDPVRFLRQGIAELHPLKADIVARRLHHHLFGIRGFHPDVVIMDNRVPYRPPAKKGLMLWHGFGWKGPNDVREFAYLHHCLKRAWGTAMEPNANFRWQTFGPWDFKHRTEVSGFHPDNCRQLGAASHDYLRMPVAREILQRFYPFDVVTRKTVLLAPTWHYGEVFAHWGNDADILDRLLNAIAGREANVILRLHDSFRYNRGYLGAIRDLAAKHRHVLLKFKDESPDNILDMQAADVLITNFSSIANLFYATRRPTVHIYPVADADQEFMWRRYTPLGVYGKKVESVKFIWKLPPEENGGLLARSPGELLDQVDLALALPDCCRERTEQFLRSHMLGGDGGNCSRIWSALEELTKE